jgi:hypothetical protein
MCRACRRAGQLLHCLRPLLRRIEVVGVTKRRGTIEKKGSPSAANAGQRFATDIILRPFLIAQLSFQF